MTSHADLAALLYPSVALASYVLFQGVVGVIALREIENTRKDRRITNPRELIGRYDTMAKKI